MVGEVCDSGNIMENIIDHQAVLIDSLLICCVCL